MKIAILFIFAFSSRIAMAYNPDCNLPMSQVNVSQISPYSYTTELLHKLIKVGGPSEKLTAGFDQEAVKRSLIICAPGILRCLQHHKSGPLSGELRVSFDLFMKTKTDSEARGLKIESKTFKSPDLLKCLVGVWSKTTYPGFPDKFPKVSVSVPVQIR